MKKDVYIYSFVGLLVDVLTKVVMTIFLSYGKSVTIIDGFFKFTMVHNTGGAFGLFKNNTLLLGLIGLAFTSVFIYYIEKTELKLIEKISCSMILSGIVGNLIDRVVRGYVIDFLDFNLFGYDYPVFNIADIFIVVGIIVMVMVSLKESSKWKIEKKD